VLRKADGQPSRDAYVNAVLALYRTSPGTSGHVRKADLHLARQLYDRGVALQVVDDAIVVALSRRLVRSTPPAEPIRSLHYFLGVVEELITGPLDPGYVVYLRGCLTRHLARRTAST
jgi:hypothetical protein